MIDGEVFDAALEAHDAIKELDHIRRSIIEHVAEDNHSHLDGLIDYARDELDDAEAAFKGFYAKLTGKPLIGGRVR